MISTLVSSSLACKYTRVELNVANALAYYATASIAAVKSFKVQAPGEQNGIFKKVFENQHRLDQMALDKMVVGMVAS
jgi:hypothetical protein